MKYYLSGNTKRLGGGTGKKEESGDLNSQKSTRSPSTANKMISDLISKYKTKIVPESPKFEGLKSIENFYIPYGAVPLSAIYWKPCLSIFWNRELNLLHLNDLRQAIVQISGKENVGGGLSPPPPSATSPPLCPLGYYLAMFNGPTGGHSGRVVTLSPPTSEAGVRFPAWPQVGKLVVACCWSAVYSI